MLFNINVSLAAAPPGAGFNISVQVEAPDVVAALEGSKDAILKSAAASARALYDSLPAAQRTPLETPAV